MSADVSPVERSSLGRHVLVVFTSPTDQRDEEFNRWYNDVHLDEVLAVEGFVAAQRFRVAAAQNEGSEPPEQYMAIYEAEADDAAEVIERLNRAVPMMDISPTLDSNHAKAWLYSAIGDRRDARSRFQR